MQILLLLFILMPIAEIALLLQVGDMIGGWNTVGLIIVTAFVGAYLVRQEGLSTLQKAQQKMANNEVPGKEMMEGLMLVIAGVLLVTPGFITDIIGFLFVLPFSRQLMAGQLAKQMTVRAVQGGNQSFYYSNTQQRPGNEGDPIEGEYTDTTRTDESKRLDR
ncbi:MAG: FxsA family protein [Aestuariibacter sp.]|uniref:FxsA family protein n=1 Tax=Marisediminitalea aggregata TaxID=634436 RepID=UPI0020CCCE4C|nr:FxsA family protein [Marisediminitalea aggregata]MCP3866078.1 FxsA family protein [Aestuariibacter sp.]MCP4234517.1 FxsA family protein [Aestuariibacter sp.]MCP4525612.1 FxsA family protein [Aestuariibacter sp.]MCP4946156.1 FxsA family protein [Aestuariibacter sp.]MCP9476347.1 FxsA family protein [Marisediminitalea aggregata]